MKQDRTQIISVKDACEMLDCSAPSIYRWERDGVLPFKKIHIGHSKVGFRLSDIEKFISNQIEKTEA